MDFKEIYEACNREEKNELAELKEEIYILREELEELKALVENNNLEKE